MFIQIRANANGFHELSVVYLVAELPRDFKRVLRLQFKEFLYYLDEKPRKVQAQPAQETDLVCAT